MTKPPIELSPAEWEIMHTIWRSNEPATVRDVVDRTYPNGEKAYTTVQTLMNILVDKGVLSRSKEGRQNVYTSTVAQQDALHGSLQGAARRLFHGNFGAMASFLVGAADLSPEEIARLRRILDEKEEDAS
ncbi:BlaI/MecI/CopY family transcriptional regulator [Candidatus Neomarinimicrobiota bacterium]